MALLYEQVLKNIGITIGIAPEMVTPTLNLCLSTAHRKVEQKNTFEESAQRDKGGGDPSSFIFYEPQSQRVCYIA